MAGKGPGSGAEAVGVAIATAITSVIISKLSGKIADTLSGSSEDDSERMYQEIHSKIGQHSFHLPGGDIDAAVARKVKIKTVMDRPQTMAFVTGAIEQLKEAKKSTHCGVCQERLDEAIKAVIQKAKVIKVSDAKYHIMQDLKRAGKIPKNATWNQLKPEQKTFINNIAERGIS